MSDIENVVQMQPAEGTEKPYTLRALRDDDLWNVLGIICNVLPDDIASIFVSVATGEKDVEEVGKAAVSRIVIAVLKNIGKDPAFRDDVYAFLSDVSGLAVDEIRGMPFGTTPAMIWDIVKDKRNTDFFRGAFKSR